jgi:hypothetical protein
MQPTQNLNSPEIKKVWNRIKCKKSMMVLFY